MSVVSPITSSVPLVERIDRAYPRTGKLKKISPRVRDNPLGQLRVSWLDEQPIKWRWIKKAQCELNYACFECGVVDIRPALEAELVRRSGLEFAFVSEQLLVDQCLLQVFDLMVVNELSLNDAFQLVLDSVSHDIAA